MATQAERFRSEQERHGKPDRKRRKPAARRPAQAETPPSPLRKRPTRRASKATYAIEPTQPGKRPSRKSTRASANRVKPDASFNRREEAAKTSPDSRYRKERARQKRVRGALSGAPRGE